MVVLNIFLFFIVSYAVQKYSATAQIVAYATRSFIHTEFNSNISASIVRAVWSRTNGRVLSSV